MRAQSMPIDGEKPEGPVMDNIKTKDDYIAEVQGLIDTYRHHIEEAPEPDDDAPVAPAALTELSTLVKNLPPALLADIVTALKPDDRPLFWGEVREDRREQVLENMDDDARLDLIGDVHSRNENTVITAFELHNGRLRQINIERSDDLRGIAPIWVDLVAPTADIRRWVGGFFGVQLPDPASLTDLEASARFYVEDNGEVHLHTDFLLDMAASSSNVAVALILYRNVLFSVRTEELPVFRLQRLRARTQSGYVSDGQDVLLDLYAADAEYSASALEDVYVALDRVSKHVLGVETTDTEAARILAAIASEEDLNGRIRRNVHDTRRAVSFLIRGKFLNANQIEDGRQILRDIESLDGHTAFLFNKINFLMDATVGFVNINQNKVVKRLTVISVVFMPLNVLAGMGGMSEFSMMTRGIPWPIAYGAFAVVLLLIGLFTFSVIRWIERRRENRIARLGQKYLRP